MRVTSSAAVLAALPITTTAAALYDWEPRIEDINALGTRCANVYKQQITACSNADFQQGAVCTPGCISSLKALATTVQMACAKVDFGADTTPHNAIMYFLAGVGPQRLCPNNDVAQTTIVSSTAIVVTTTTSTAPASPTSTSSKTISQPKTSTSSSFSAAPSSKHPMTSVTSAISTTVQLVTTSATSSTAAPSNSQHSKDDGSGGGSPFDTPSSAIVLSVPIATTLLAAILLAAGMR